MSALVSPFTLARQRASKLSRTAMSSTSLKLEDEIAQMEGRLASVKVTVDVEREAWRSFSRTGKHGTKWRGAAPKGGNSSGTPATSAPEKDPTDSGEELTVMPMYWDSLELAQYLQGKQLAWFAQAVVSEQISGKMLLDTPPGKLRALFQGAESMTTGPVWKSFLRVCSFLHRQQQKLEKLTSAAPSSTRSDSSGNYSRDAAIGRGIKAQSEAIGSREAAESGSVVFPLISPRGVVGCSTGGAGSERKGAESAKRMNLGASHRKPVSNNSLPLVTCWNCGTRFARPAPKFVGSKKSSSLRSMLSARPYCSKACQEHIEQRDMSVTASVSASVCVGGNSQLSTAVSGSGGNSMHVPVPRAVVAAADSRIAHQVRATKSSGGAAVRTHTMATRGAIASNNNPEKNDIGLELLQIGTTKLGPDLHPHPPTSSGIAPTMCSSPPAARGRGRSNNRGVAASSFVPVHTTVSIPSNNRSLDANPMTLEVGSSTRGATAQSRVFLQSRYKLDPQVFQAHRVTFATVFGGFSPSSSSSANARGNLLKLQDFLNTRALHRLSLTSRAWFDLITQPSAYSDALWGVHVLRTWRHSEQDDQLLATIGVIPKPERPRRMLMKLTRQVGRVVLENMKTLLNTENWQLAGILSANDAADATTLSSYLTTLRRGGERAIASPRSSRLPAELYEHITIIYNLMGEIVAIQSNQLLRPLEIGDKSGAATLTSVLQGLQRGHLHAVQCRRLRLFSLANRLPFEQWHLLPSTRSVLDFFWTSADKNPAQDLSAPPMPVWHQKVLGRLQTTLQQRLLGKESVQQVMRGLQERNGPPEVLIFLERFLVATHAAAPRLPHSPKSRLTDS